MYSKQRLTLFGHLETLDTLQEASSKLKDLQKCYLSYHPDARHFIPGSDSPHLALWTRFIVDKVYRVGGYGDESQIGWLELNRWQRAGRSSKGEWQKEWDQTWNTLKAPYGSFTHSDRLAALFADNFDDSKGQELELVNRLQLQVPN